jgi:hypothetical protein
MMLSLFNTNKMSGLGTHQGVLEQNLGSRKGC